jgi:hypothetical protein
MNNDIEKAKWQIITSLFESISGPCGLFYENDYVGNLRTINIVLYDSEVPSGFVFIATLTHHLMKASLRCFYHFSDKNQHDILISSDSYNYIMLAFSTICLKVAPDKMI